MCFVAAVGPVVAVRLCCLICRAASDAAHMAEADAKAALAAESAADEAAAAQAVLEGEAVSLADAAAAALSVAEPPSAPLALSTVLREVAAAQQNDTEQAQVRPLSGAFASAFKGHRQMLTMAASSTRQVLLCRAEEHLSQ